MLCPSQNLPHSWCLWKHDIDAKIEYRLLFCCNLHCKCCSAVVCYRNNISRHAAHWGAALLTCLAFLLVADIYEKVSEELEKDGHLDCECIGGGRIKHDPQAKKIHVYGYSMVRRSVWTYRKNPIDIIIKYNFNVKNIFFILFFLNLKSNIIFVIIVDHRFGSFHSRDLEERTIQ